MKKREILPLELKRLQLFDWATALQSASCCGRFFSSLLSNVRIFASTHDFPIIDLIWARTELMTEKTQLNWLRSGSIVTHPHDVRFFRRTSCINSYNFRSCATESQWCYVESPDGSFHQLSPSSESICCTLSSLGARQSTCSFRCK